METYKTKQEKTFEHLKEAFGYKNVMQTPRIQKIVVSSGTGKRARVERGMNDLVSDRLGKITGQKPSVRGARASIAGFKIRENDPVGQMVTLRGKRAQTFFDKLVNVALPRTKDFRGIPRSSVDSMGNITIGMKDHTVFPEATEEELKDVFGLSVTIVTSATSKKEALAYLEHLGVPLQKEKEVA